MTEPSEHVIPTSRVTKQFWDAVDGSGMGSPAIASVDRTNTDLTTTAQATPPRAAGTVVVQLVANAVEAVRAANDGKGVYVDVYA